MFRAGGVSANEYGGRHRVSLGGDGTADEYAEEHRAGDILDRRDVEHEPVLSMFTDEVRTLPSYRGFTVGFDPGADGGGKECRHGRAG